MPITRHPLIIDGPLAATPLDSDLVTRLASTFLCVGEREEAFAAAFVAELERRTSTHAVAIADVRERILPALGLVIWSLCRAADTRSKVASFGRQLELLGVDPRNQAAWSTALLSALAHTSGPRWNAELREDWSLTFELIAALLIAG
jgi:hypothetical protein